VASHPVGHSADAAKNRSGTVLLQSVTLAFRAGGDVGSGAQRTCRLERSQSLRVGESQSVSKVARSGKRLLLWA